MGHLPIKDKPMCVFVSTRFRHFLRIFCNSMIINVSVHDFLYLYCKYCYSLIIYSSSASY